MTANEFVGRLQGVHEVNGGWSARCPAHDDHNASLRVTAGDDGRVLLHCHAGCETTKIVAAIGLKMSDLFPQKSVSGPAQVKRIVKTYRYTDAEGALVFEVVRFDPKDFRQRRPDSTKPDGWAWDLKGVTRVLYRLPDVLKAKAAGQTIYVVEGEKDAEALVRLGLCATCNAGGAGKWEPHYTEALAGAKVVVFPDKDVPGLKHAALVVRELTGKAESVAVVELPDRDGRKIKDAADWIAAGGTAAALQEIISNAPAWVEPVEQCGCQSAEKKVEETPVVLLPHGEQSISAAGRDLGKLLDATGRFFMRSNAVVRLTRDRDGVPQFEDVKPAALASDFETVALLSKKGKNGYPELTTCCEQTAKLIASSSAFKAELPPIRVLTQCPVLIERGGVLVQIKGYDRESGIFAAGEPAENVNLDEAKLLLNEMLDGFRFATASDKARALAAMITPALVFGGLLRGFRAPLDLGEADSSQTGKGYRNKLTSALYSQSVRTITQQKGGVGGMEESFNMALIRGANFIALDNIRGKIDSPSFESFMTEEVYSARAPYREPIEIDPKRVVVMMTSNKADMTTDLANRSSCVRLLKQSDGYQFKSYPEGDVLEHVRANQPKYLGAVFAVIRAWHAAGKQRTLETRHDFRPWAQAMDWITINLLDAGPLLEGHRETQARMTNPVLGWLRDVAIETVRVRKGMWLRAGEILDVLAMNGVEIPGLAEGADLTDTETRKAVLQAMGRRLGLCFKAGESITSDGMVIERREVYDPAVCKNVKEYRVTKPVAEKPATCGKPEPDSVAAKTEPAGRPETGASA